MTTCDAVNNGGRRTGERCLQRVFKDGKCATHQPDAHQRAFHGHDDDVGPDGFTYIHEQRCRACDGSYFGTHSAEACARVAALNEEFSSL